MPLYLFVFTNLNSQYLYTATCKNLIINTRKQNIYIFLHNNLKNAIITDIINIFIFSIINKNTILYFYFIFLNKIKKFLSNITINKFYLNIN